MEYPKQKKTKWWLILLFIPLLVGCNPITQGFIKISISLGEELIGTAVGSTIEIVLDKLTKYFFKDHVNPYPGDPFKGHYTGNLEFQKETPDCKFSYTVKEPEMYRDSIQSKWKIVPEIRQQVYQLLDQSCPD